MQARSDRHRARFRGRHPRQQPILDEILEVTRHNERVRRLRDIIEMAFGGITERVSQVIDIDLDRLVEPPAEEDLARWSEQLNPEAQAAAGSDTRRTSGPRSAPSWGAMREPSRELSDFPEDCNQAEFVRTVLRTWARERLFTERDGRLRRTTVTSRSCGGSTSTTAPAGCGS